MRISDWSSDVCSSDLKILTEPKNAITKQFHKLFDMERVELEFRQDALSAIARKALKRKTGARGLRTIVESVLLDTMYDLPSPETVSKVGVDHSVVEHHSEPRSGERRGGTDGVRPCSTRWWTLI